METLVQVLAGDELDKKEECTFCFEQSTKMILSVKRKRRDGYMLTGVPVCSDHYKRMELILSGDFDIDNIKLNKNEAKGTGPGVRMRG